jgi:glycosyltransferase involved in cell wall biosynthesis
MDRPVYRGLSVIVVAPVLDEERKIGEVVRRAPRPTVDEVLVVDDGSTDGSAAVARGLGATVISLGRTVGVGAALRAGYRHAIERGYDVVVTVAGNNKDAPEEIPALLDPIADGRADFVQGSRWLRRDAGFGAMPIYRRLATRVHPLLFSLVARRWVTESTNGFRAIRATVLADPRLDLDAPWLDEYELEPYLYLRAIRLGYRTAEVPVTKIYPPRALGQTKMKPVTGWWSILRPLVYVGLGLRR